MPGGGLWADTVRFRMPEADLYPPIKQFLEAQGRGGDWTEGVMRLLRLA